MTSWQHWLYKSHKFTNIRYSCHKNSPIILESNVAVLELPSVFNFQTNGDISLIQPVTVQICDHFTHSCQILDVSIFLIKVFKPDFLKNMAAWNIKQNYTATMFAVSFSSNPYKIASSITKRGLVSKCLIYDSIHKSPSATISLQMF